MSSFPNLPRPLHDQTFLQSSGGFLRLALLFLHLFFAHSRLTPALQLPPQPLKRIIHALTRHRIRPNNAL